MIPSRRDPPAGLPRLGRYGNGLLWRLARRRLNGRLLKHANDLRQWVGLPPARDLVDDVWASRQLTLVAVSRALCRPRDDWPPWCRVCGYLDRPSMTREGAIPQDLERFLVQGPPPILVTFGSLMPADPDAQREVVALLTRAVDASGQRAVIQAPGWEACGFVPSGRVVYVGSAPHRELIPRCAAVVHHGGAGTTQTVCLAGRPSVVVPHIAEQSLWARELARAGVAPAALPRRRLTVGRLARRIARVTQDPRFAAKARAVAAAMRRENGVTSAVALIEERFADAANRR